MKCEVWKKKFALNFSFHSQRSFEFGQQLRLATVFGRRRDEAGNFPIVHCCVLQ